VNRGNRYFAGEREQNSCDLSSATPNVYIYIIYGSNFCRVFWIVAKEPENDFGKRLQIENNYESVPGSEYQTFGATPLLNCTNSDCKPLEPRPGLRCGTFIVTNT
jgi:hypothetical protein